MVTKSTPDYQREHYRKQQNGGICPHCSLPAEPGRVLCTKHLAYQREKRRETTRRKREQGICTNCPSPAVVGYRLCERHRAAVRQRVQSEQERAKQERLCLLCWKPNSSKKKHCDDCRSERAKKRHKLKIEVLSHYGGSICKCCGETLLPLLSLDHVDGGGARHRRQLRVKAGIAFYARLKRLGFPNDPALEVLCIGCNVAKGLYGICPHQLKSA